MFIYLAAASIIVTIIAFLLDQAYGKRLIIQRISTLLAKANLFSYCHDNNVGGHPSPINSRQFQESVEEHENDKGHELEEEDVEEEEEDEKKEEEKLKRVRSHLGIMMTLFLVGAMVVLVAFFIVALYYKDRHMAVQSSAQPDDRRKRLGVIHQHSSEIRSYGIPRIYSRKKS